MSDTRSADLVAKQRLALTLKTMQARIDTLEQSQTEAIAIVGIGLPSAGRRPRPGRLLAALADWDRRGDRGSRQSLVAGPVV